MSRSQAGYCITGVDSFIPQEGNVRRCITMKIIRNVVAVLGVFALIHGLTAKAQTSQQSGHREITIGLIARQAVS